MVPIWCEDTLLVYFIRWANHTYVCLNYYISIHPTIHYHFVGFQQKKIPVLKQVIMMNVKNLECSHLGLCCQINALQNGIFFIKFRYHEVKTMGSFTCWSLTNKLHWRHPCLTERWAPQRYAFFPYIIHNIMLALQENMRFLLTKITCQSLFNVNFSLLM